MFITCAAGSHTIACQTSLRDFPELAQVKRVTLLESFRYTKAAALGQPVETAGYVSRRQAEF